MYVPVLFALLPGLLPASPPNYIDYNNARFGYHVSYPQDLLRALPEADNGDGREFQPINGHARIKVWGSWVEADPVVSARSDVDFEQKDCAGGKATYRLDKPGLHAMSCMTPNGDVLYAKATQYKDTVAVLEMRYPQSEKAMWEPVVQAMANSLLAMGPPEVISSPSRSRK